MVIGSGCYATLSVFVGVGLPNPYRGKTENHFSGRVFVAVAEITCYLDSDTYLACEINFKGVARNVMEGGFSERNVKFQAYVV